MSSSPSASVVEVVAATTSSNGEEDARPLSQLFGSLPAHLQPMQQALEDMIQAYQDNPIDTKPNASAFLSALQECSRELVLSEAHPVWFWECAAAADNNNNSNDDSNDQTAKEASRTYLTFWMFRRVLFGSKRAFRSVLQGDAFASKEFLLRNIRLGALVQLPNDRDGRSVFLFDLGKRIPANTSNEMGLEFRAGLFFYVLSLAMTNPISRTQGIVYLVSVPPHNKGSVDIPNGDKLVTLVDKAMPIKVHSRYIVCCCSTTTSSRLLTKEIVPYIKRATGEGIFPDAYTHLGHSPADLGRHLQQQGLSREHLPPSLGGTWDKERFYQAVESRLCRVG